MFCNLFLYFHLLISFRAWLFSHKCDPNTVDLGTTTVNLFQVLKNLLIIGLTSGCSSSSHPADLDQTRYALYKVKININIMNAWNHFVLIEVCRNMEETPGD